MVQFVDSLINVNIARDIDAAGTSLGSGQDTKSWTLSRRRSTELVSHPSQKWDGKLFPLDCSNFLGDNHIWAGFEH